MSDRDPSFEDLPITERAREAAHAQGWRKPTPIQAAVVPQLAVGRDVIGRAETGSGKTAAFGLVLTDAVSAPGVQALVLAPTRELAQQIARDLNALAAKAPFRAVAVYGGVPYDAQLEAFADPETTCIVATPGRLLDLMDRKQAFLENVRVLVIDEADRMLDLGFLRDVERIIKLVPGSRQTALFTATMPKKVADLARKYMSHPREIEVGSATPVTAKHYRVDVPSNRKFQALVALLDQENPRRVLVFARTRDGADELARLLKAEGVDASPLHGDLDQPSRERVLAAFAAGDARAVVATDVAARGLDVPGVTHVVNYDVPEEPDAYVHRAGRTARAGRTGRVFTLVTENDAGHAEAGEKAAGITLEPFPLTVAEDGRDVVITHARPLKPRAPPKGGNAKGVRSRKTKTPPRLPSERALKKEPEPEGPEFKLPRSRRGRRRD